MCQASPAAARCSRSACPRERPPAATRQFEVVVHRFTIRFTYATFRCYLSQIVRSNVLFFADGDTPRLAPAFDQVSMLYAPTADGQVPPRELAVPLVTSDTLDVWDDARDAARQFWAQASEDARLSDDVRAQCTSNAAVLVSGQ